MLKRVDVPSTPDKFAWQRFRAFIVSEEMQGGASDTGQTPGEAAFAADDRVKSIFASVLPQETFPLNTSDAVISPLNDGGLPGQVQTNDGRFWVILARTRNKDESPDGATDRQPITHEHLGGMAKSYNPLFRSAPVILPTGGPAHFTGEFDRQIPGRVDALEYDGLELWGLLSESPGFFEGQLRFIVEDGALQRSIGWQVENTELPGNPPYLRHVAFLTGEQPAIVNLTPLDQFFMKEEGVSDDEFAALEGQAMRFMSLSDPPTNQRSTTMKKEDKQKTNLDGTPGFEDPGEDLLATIKKVVLEAIGDLAPKPEKKEEKPVEDGRFAAIEASIGELANIVKTAVASSATAADDARKTRVQSQLDHLVRGRKLTPAMREIHEQHLLNKSTTDEEVGTFLESLGKLSPIVPNAEPNQIVDEDLQVFSVDRFLTAPPEMGYGVDGHDVAIELRAQKAAEAVDGDRQAKFEAYRKVIFAEYGQQAHQDVHVLARTN